MTEAANPSPSPDGNPSPQPNGVGSPGASNPTPSSAPVRPAEMADKAFDAYFDPAKGVKFDVFTKDFNELRSFKAQDDLRRAAVPAKAEEYKLALPQAFEMPKGPDGKPVEFKFDETDPRLAPVRAFALARGIDQAGFSELLAIHAQYEIGEMQQINGARAAEQAKLGANGPARVDAVSRILSAKLGSDRGAALMDRLMLSSDIEIMEDLLKQFSTQGGGQFNQSHRESQSEAWDEEAYQKSGPAGSTARVEYAAAHAPRPRAN